MKATIQQKFSWKLYPARGERREEERERERGQWRGDEKTKENMNAH